MIIEWVKLLLREFIECANCLGMRFRRERAKELISNRGLVRRWVANQIGVTSGSLKVYLNNDLARPGKETIRKLAELLGVPESELWEPRESVMQAAS